MSKYFNNAIIGNSSILGCLTDKGELIRLYYPNIDYFQNIDMYKIGIQKDNRVIWNSDGALQRQYYDENVLCTELLIDDIKIEQRDYILSDKNIMVRHIKYSSNVNTFIYSKLNSNVNKLVSGMLVKNSLIQYCQNMYMATFSNKEISNYQINNARYTIENANLTPEDYIGMSDDSAIIYNNVNELTLYIAFEETQKEIISTIEWCKNQDEEKLYKNTIKEWKDYLSRLPNTYNRLNEKESAIIKQSILLFKILSDKNTGGILASPDIDENFTKCGRYGYCWARDALFINKALLLLGMNDIVEKFYEVWATKAQLDNGLFEQRYYSTGELAPSWGIQIDETASILIGLNEIGRCKRHEELIVRATEGLLNYIGENSLGKPCFDIWEERKGHHLYSYASIYAALKTSRKMLLKIGKPKNKKLISDIEKIMPKLKDTIDNMFIKDDRYIRSENDFTCDMSTIGVGIPFEIADINSNIFKNTIQKIEEKLKLDNGGYLRYENDTYVGGNAWIISSLWLAMYYIKIGNKEKAKELYDWVTNHAGGLNFLPEQIERNGHQTAWVSQLAWSHALYVIVSKELLK